MVRTAGGAPVEAVAGGFDMAGPTLRSTMPACAARPSLLEALESRTHLSVTHAQPHRVADPDVFWYVPPGENEPVEREPRFVPTAQKWPQPGGLATPVSLGYSFSNLLDGGMPGGLTAAQLTAAIVEAMEVWTAVTPLQLTQRIDSGPAAGDGSYLASTHPQLRFGHHFIDGATGLNTLAHAYFPVSSTQANAEGLAGDTHFDNGNTWALTPGGSAIDILETATHEFGHAIGLNHEPTPANGGQLAIMNPVYAGHYSGPGSAFLFADDIAGIQSRYGVGLGYVLDLGGTLHISGTEVANTFSLSVAAGMLSASSVGFGSFTIPAAGVTSIVINGRGGADTFNLGPTGVPVTVNGGAGDDVVRATDGPASFRFVGGEGDNTPNLVRGTYSFSHDLSDGAANLTLNVGTDNVGAALVTLGATQYLAGLNLGPGALATMAVNGNRYLYTRGLSIDATAELDLNDNDLLLDYSGSSSSFYAAVKSHVTTGRATGTRGITSTAAAENQVHAPVDNAQFRSEERRVGKDGGARGAAKRIVTQRS